MSYLTVRKQIRKIPRGSITTMEKFIAVCLGCTNDEIFFLFEEGPCGQQLRDEIYALADHDDSEPFRGAMIKLGFEDY